MARGALVQTRISETEETAESRILNLYLDQDARYRWYEDAVPTPVSARTMEEVIAAAMRQWTGFELIEFRGRTVERDEDVEESYAADELQRLRRTAKRSAHQQKEKSQ